jgi:hypothetical protein
MAALVHVLVFSVMNVLMDVLLAFMLMRMFMFIICMATHVDIHLRLLLLTKTMFKI